MIWTSESDPNVMIADAAVVVVRESLTSDRVLAVHRRERPEQRCLPGGSIESGETARAAAVRELEEEVGLVLPASALIFVAAVEIVVGAGVPPIVALFEVSHAGGYVPAPSEREPELRPHWARLLDLCDVERNGDFAESARWAATLLRRDSGERVERRGRGEQRRRSDVEKLALELLLRR